MENLQRFRSLDRSLRLQKIIDTAVDLFHIKGYRATTLGGQSEKSQIVIETLKKQCKSMPELLEKIEHS